MERIAQLDLGIHIIGNVETSSWNVKGGHQFLVLLATLGAKNDQKS